MNKVPITWLDKLIQFEMSKEKAREKYSNSKQGLLDSFLRPDLYNYNMYGRFPHEHPSVQEKFERLNRSIKSSHTPSQNTLQQEIKKWKPVWDKTKKTYNKVNEFLNPGNRVILIDPNTGEAYETSVNSGAGVMIDLMDPAAAIGKVDDVAKLVKNLDSVKDKWDALRKYKLHRKRLSTKDAKKRVFRNAENKFGDLSKLDEYNVDAAMDYVNDKIDGNYNKYLDILWERGDLDGIKHPKIEYKYEELPF